MRDGLFFATRPISGPPPLRKLHQGKERKKKKQPSRGTYIDGTCGNINLYTLYIFAICRQNAYYKNGYIVKHFPARLRRFS